MNSALERWIRLRSLRAPLSRIGFGILGRQFDLAAGDAAALVDDVDRGLGGLVVPDAPRRNHAGEIAMMTDDDRARCLREGVLA